MGMVGVGDAAGHFFHAVEKVFFKNGLKIMRMVKEKLQPLFISLNFSGYCEHNSLAGMVLSHRKTIISLLHSSL